MTRFDNFKIAVLIPCFNEETTVSQVVADFKTVLPKAEIYVYDNNSTDNTASRAFQSGAIVYSEKKQGKGNVVRRMFADVDADIYVLVDGDATYHAPSVLKLLAACVDNNCDFVNGSRVERHVSAYRPGHRFGNAFLTKIVGSIFGTQTLDMLSGFKVLSNRFVKSFPAHSSGFEIETELMIHALELRMSVCEIPTPYDERPTGSLSKLNTFRDGFRILKIIALIVKEERPFQVFGGAGALFATASIIFGGQVVVEFAQTGLVERLPTAVLASALMIVAVLSIFAGLILDTVTSGRREIKRLAYLALASPRHKLQTGKLLMKTRPEKSLKTRDIMSQLHDLGEPFTDAVRKKSQQ